MKSTQTIFNVLIVFYLIVGVGYTAWTSIENGQVEWVGAVCFFLLAAFSTFVGFYLGVERKPFRNRPLPEDRLDANIEDADEDLGFYPPSSWWPLVCSVAIGVILFGIAVGWWVVFFAAPLLVIGILGWVFQYYTGDFKH